jgi:hypothetical protein
MEQTTYKTDVFSQAVAALYEIPDQQVEAIHLAIALSYYGLLRVPLRNEASDVEICARSANQFISTSQMNVLWIQCSPTPELVLPL